MIEADRLRNVKQKSEDVEFLGAIKEHRRLLWVRR
jgi:hypothetical protein